MLEWLLALAADGEPPTVLRDRPEIPDHLTYIYDAFRAMWGDRHPIAFYGYGKIPFVALDTYARRKRIDSPDQFDRFERIISRMDETFMEWQAEQARRRGNKNGATS